MKSIDVEALARPISAEEPSGPDLEYDPDFMALEEAARTEPEQQFGDTIVAAREPDWPKVRELACAVLARSKDLRAALYLVQALTQGNGLSGLAQGLQLFHRLLTTYWDSLHPQLDPEDDLDPTERVNLVASLCDGERILTPVRHAPMVQIPGLGGISWRDVLIARGQWPPPEEEEEVLKLDSIEAAIRDLEPDQVQAAQETVASALANLSAIEQGLLERVGVSQAVSLEALSTLLQEIRDFLGEQMQAQAPAPAPPEETEAGEERQPAATSTQRGIPGEISSQQEVVQALDRIIAYYQKQEPASPVPLLLERAKRLVSASFLEILQDIAPDGLSQAEQITGARLEEE